MRSIVLVIALATVGCKNSKQPDTEASAPSHPAATERPRLTRSAPLPQLARQDLRDRMIDHGDDMESLLWTVLMLDHESAQSVAERIGSTPAIGRPLPDDLTTLNAQLPAEFFELQDQLYRATDALAVAAKQRDDGAIAEQFARLSKSCVNCHSLYLRIPASPEE